MPSSGKKSVKQFLRNFFPDCQQLSTTGLHKPPPVLQQVFLQAESVNLSAAIEEGDAYLLRRDDAKRRQQRAAVDATLDDESEAVAPFPVDDSAAVEADRKWRQQCMLDALASSGCEGVGHPSKGRVALDPQITLALRDSTRGSFSSNLTAEEVAIANSTNTLIFVNTVETALEVSTFLKKAAPGLKFSGLHKRLSSEERDEAFQNFQDGSIRVLVCTDVAARGLDTINVEHVIQYDVATDAASYLHRLGRTGRMGRPGRITTLVGPESERLVSDVLHLTLEGEDLGAVFSRKRSLRRKQKKRAEAQDEKEIQALNTESTVSAAA